MVWSFLSLEMVTSYVEAMGKKAKLGKLGQSAGRQLCTSLILGKQCLGGRQWQHAERTHAVVSVLKTDLDCPSNFLNKSPKHSNYPGFAQLPKSVQLNQYVT